MVDVSHDAAPLPDRVGKYKILSHIATGGMGAVYKAHDVDLDRLVALKIVPPELARQEKILLRFRREAQAAAQLRHENIVAIFDVGESDGTHFLALEFVEGTDLQDYINRQCRLDAETARQIMIQATRALAHAHEQGIVHRDIKPSNFLLTFHDNHLRVKLTDFGLAIRRENDDDFRITRDGTTVGTVDYMSPEQARDSQSADIRSDIYSLGCTFFHMLAGVAPFARGSMPERLILHMQKLPPDLRRFNKSLPVGLIAIINRMLEKKAADRYQTPAELLHDLENFRVDSANKAPGRSGTKKAKLGGTRKLNLDPTVVVENKDIMEDAEDAAKVKTAAEKTTPAEVEQERLPQPRPRPVPRRGAADKKVPAIEEEDADEPIPRTAKPSGKKSKSKGSRPKQPTWVYVAAAAGGMFLLLVFLALATGGRAKRPKDNPKPDPPVAVLPEQKPEIAPPVVVEAAPANLSAGEQPLLVMKSLASPLDHDALLLNFFGSLTGFEEEEPKRKSLQVRRLADGSGGAFCSIADALAHALPQGETGIAIHDNGPLYLRSLPPMKGQSILLYAADGYRPLIVWEIPKSSGKEKNSASLLPFAQGTITLKNLDVVVKWAEERPAVLFDLQDANFFAVDCTFSLFSKSPQGITLVKTRTMLPELKKTRHALTRLTRCYVRGADVTLWDVQQTSAKLWLEDSLVVGQNQPLLQVRARDLETLEWSCIRSTLVTSQTLLRCPADDATKASAPQVHALVVDSILSRDDPASAVGDLVHLGTGVEPSRMTWKATNSVYAGWKRLLGSDAKQFGGADVESWQRQWNAGAGDRALVEPWPINPPSRLEETPASLFLVPVPSLLAYRASSHSGAIGCRIGRLPPEPGNWGERTFDLPPEPVVTASDNAIPAIDPDADGLYHGEKLDLNKIDDLGAYLANVLLKMKPAPRVVFHLNGTGSHLTSSIRLKGIQDLILYFEPDRDRKNPLVLGINPTTIKQRAPLIEMTGGNLEIIGARIQLSPLTLVSSMIQVQEGDLTLTRCWLQGPLPKAPDGFKCLLSLSNTAERTATLTLRDNILVSSKMLVSLQDHVQLKARNNLFFSLGDGVHIAGEAAKAGATSVLDHNTWGIKQTIFTVEANRQGLPAAPLRLYANSNAFLNPFATDANTTLLRGAEALVGHGAWIWQGRHNVYDARLHSYFAGLGKAAGEAQTLAAWQKNWGQAGEAEPLVLENGPKRKTLAIETIAPQVWLQQLDRLALPPLLRGDPNQSPPGADLVALRILTKKG